MAESINVDTIDHMLENKKSQATVDSIYIDSIDGSVQKNNGVANNNGALVNSGSEVNKSTTKDIFMKIKKEYELGSNFETFGQRTDPGSSGVFMNKTLTTVESKVVENVTLPSFKIDNNNQSTSTIDSIYVDTPDAQRSKNRLELRQESEPGLIKK